MLQNIYHCEGVTYPCDQCAYHATSTTSLKNHIQEYIKYPDVHTVQELDFMDHLKIVNSFTKAIFKAGN